MLDLGEALAPPAVRGPLSMGVAVTVQSPGGSGGFEDA